MVKNTYCFCRGPVFGSQHPCGSSQPGDPISSSGLYRDTGVYIETKKNKNTYNFKTKQVEQIAPDLRIRKSSRNQEWSGVGGWNYEK